jgi:hypothetical protein
MSLDALARAASRLAREQQITVVRLQSESIAGQAGHLRQSRIRLDVLGNYVATKALLIELLSKFPGLTLEHFAIRHASGPSGVDAGVGARPSIEDRASIELIQYSVPEAPTS